MTVPAAPRVSITAEEWADVYPRLLLFARKRYGWHCKRYGWQPDDLVHDAIRDTLWGKRRWRPIEKESGEVNEDITLYQFLCGVIRGGVSHRARREARIRPLECIHDVAAGDKADSQAIENELADTLLELVAGDEDLIKIVGVLRNDPGLMPRDIAEILEMSIDEYQNAQKRLRRRVKALKRENRNG